MLVLGQILKIRGHWYPPLRYGNNLCTSDKSKAEALSYFYSVFTQEKLPIPTKLTSLYNLISDIDISAHGVHKQLLQLNPRKACGPDEIPARVLLKNWPHLLHLGLVLYSNSPMTQGQYPLTELKPWLQLFIGRIQCQTLLIIALFLLLPYVVRLWNTLF